MFAVFDAVCSFLFSWVGVSVSSTVVVVAVVMLIVDVDGERILFLGGEKKEA